MSHTAVPSIAELAEVCFEELAARVDAEGQVPVEQLAKLGVLLGKNWQKALQVVDQKEVQCYQGEPSGRCIFEVHGKSGQYLTLPKTYCSCHAHYYEVVAKSEAPFCKHQLAARLAFILKSCPTTTVSDAALAEHLLAA